MLEMLEQDALGKTMDVMFFIFTGCLGLFILGDIVWSIVWFCKPYILGLWTVPGEKTRIKFGVWGKQSSGGTYCHKLKTLNLKKRGHGFARADKVYYVVRRTSLDFDITKEIEYTEAWLTVDSKKVKERSLEYTDFRTNERRKIKYNLYYAGAEWCQIYRLDVSDDTEFETIMKGGFAG